MIDELAHAGPEHLDPAFVGRVMTGEGYPDPAEDLAAFAAFGLDEGSAVVDLGSGRRAVRARRRPTVRARDGRGRLPGHAHRVA